MMDIYIIESKSIEYHTPCKITPERSHSAVAVGIILKTTEQVPSVCSFLRKMNLHCTFSLKWRQNCTSQE